jgi:hypothetical protein
MCEQRESASRNARQRRTELPLGNHSEAIDAGIDEEALNPATPAAANASMCS